MNQRTVIFLLVSIASMIGTSAADLSLRAASDANVIVLHHQRRELTWTWWTNMMNLLHGPLAYHHHDGSSSSSGSSPSSGSSGSSSSSPSSSSNSTGESDTSKEFDESNESDKSVESDGDIYDGLEYGENYSVDAGVGSSIGGITEAASVMIYIVAAMLATVIGAAMVVVWKRRKERETAQLLGTSSAFVEIGSVRNSIAYKPPSNTAAILASEC